MAFLAPFLDNDFSLSPSFAQLLLYSFVFLFVVGHLTSTYATHRNIPGPFLAKFTDLWRLYIVWRRDSHDTYLRLHQQYGDLVRIGPNCISISAPDLVPSIYGIGKGFVKSDFYSVWQNIVNGQRVASMVFTTDEVQHAAMKKPIANAYSLSTLKEFEPLLDSTTAVFLSRLDDLFASTGKVCDLGTWLQWYAFDVIGELTFSQRLGFLEKATDVEGIIASVARNFDRCSVLGQMPWLDQFTYKNPIYLKFFAKAAANPIIAFGQRRLQERIKGQEADDDAANDQQPATTISDPLLEAKVLHGTLPSKPDFLSRFLTLHKEQPEIVTNTRLLAYLFMNINAGSDTIGSTIRALFYHLLKNPDTLSTLRTELQTAQKQDNLSLPLPTWTQCQSLPYLNAVIKESLRLNPALALPLERIIPSNTPGLQIPHHPTTKETITLPPGTIVGINPWILHRDTRIFGSDAAKWNPSRWLDDDADKVKYMEHHLLAFGAGKRSCLGKNIAMLELGKLVPALVMRYEMRLAEPGREWRVWNAWAVRQEGLQVLFDRRGEGS
ncbi:putative P450 monooxygenase [Neohortaea acidophila]|uniref:Putative P450 monooxygenase n=1 Tax=Neohortaea acidophila TaxID=245834 RepID=A0A6A6PIZ9_9PEZI|nr:putative P450 monooxygenase [Neohortaea acidophila]KAF2479962.1 putative P450 monooxygenase [Neohortaea acidophila]